MPEKCEYCDGAGYVDEYDASPYWGESVKIAARIAELEGALAEAEGIINASPEVQKAMGRFWDKKRVVDAVLAEREALVECIRSTTWSGTEGAAALRLAEARITELENQLEGAEQRGALLLEVIADKDRLKAEVNTLRGTLRQAREVIVTYVAPDARGVIAEIDAALDGSTLSIGEAYAYRSEDHGRGKKT